MFISGLVLAAGGSSRLGRPKQLLEYRGRTLLDATLDMARACDFDQLIVAIGGAGEDVRAGVDLGGCTVVDNVHYTTGCSSSIVASLERVDPRADGLVLLVGDQPGVEPSSVAALVAAVETSTPAASLAMCRYADGRGHPFWFSQPMFAELSSLHGDKAVWKLIESGRWSVAEVAVDGPAPLDVDTWPDYQDLVGQLNESAP
jgi:molybdenum cofactor cytidylyltransferase